MNIRLPTGTTPSALFSPVKYEKWEEDFMDTVLDSCEESEETIVRPDQENIDALIAEYYEPSLTTTEKLTYTSPEIPLVEHTLQEMDQTLDQLSSWKQHRLQNIHRLHAKYSEALPQQEEESNQVDEEYDPVTQALSAELKRCREVHEWKKTNMGKAGFRALTPTERKQIQEAIEDPTTGTHDLQQLENEIATLELTALQKDIEINTYENQSRGEEEEADGTELCDQLLQFANDVDNIFERLERTQQKASMKVNAADSIAIMLDKD